MSTKVAALAALVALAAGGATAGIAGAQPSVPPAPPTTPTEPVLPAEAAPSAEPTSPTEAAPADPDSPAEPAPSAEPAPPAEPQSVIDKDGVFVVGTDIVPGTYVSAGPADGGVCYWKRMSDLHGGGVLDNAMSKKPQTVVIEATDKAFDTSGCQPWQKNDAAAPPSQPLPPWLTGLQLRHWVDTMNDNARQSGNGTLPPY